VSRTTRPGAGARAARAAERSTRRKLEILRSAAAAFRGRGYHGASVDQIARAVGMTKGNLYYYFRDKQEILFFCHDHSLDILLHVLRDAERSRATPDRRLHRLIAGFVHMLIDELHGSVLTMDLQALSPVHLRRVIAKRDRFDRGLRRAVADGMRAGLFAQGDVKLLTFAILGACNWITRWYDPKGPADAERIAQIFADYLLAGLRSRPPRRARAL
jgi:AcrR family transcriptional regulator